MLLLVISIILVGIAMEWGGHKEVALPAWQLKWEHAAIHDIQEAMAAPSGEWRTVQARADKPQPPAEADSVWLRFSLPQTEANSALLIDKVYGDSLKAYIDHRLIYDSSEVINYSGNKVLIPLSGEDSAKQLYLWSAGGGRDFGIGGKVRVGSYDKLLSFYVKQDLVDIVIGAALIFMGGALMICLFFLKPEFFTGGFF